MTPDNLILKISKGQIEPFYFLYGPEIFYQTEIIQALIQQSITDDNRDFNLENFDARDSTVNHWLGSAKTLSFLGGVKLVIVRNLQEAIPKDNEAQALMDYAQSPISEACLVITSNKVTDVTPLHGLKNLRFLSIKHCPIPPTQAAALRKALPNCKIFGP